MKKSELKSLIRECINEVMLNETAGQHFNFKFYKSLIIDEIKAALEGEDRSSVMASHLYQVIAGTRSTSETLKFMRDLGFTDEDVKKYKDISLMFRNRDPGAWSSDSINTRIYKEKSGTTTYNFYVTVAKTGPNIKKFIEAINNNIGDLRSEFIKLSDKYQMPIRYKTHRHLQDFVKHNDSFKVYYYAKGKNIRDDIETVTRKWFADNGITLADRSHYHGIDSKIGGKTGEGGSYGIFLSEKIADAFYDVINKHGKKYTPEQYYEWLTKNFVQMIQNAKIPDSV